MAGTYRKALHGTSPSREARWRRAALTPGLVLAATAALVAACGSSGASGGGSGSPASANVVSARQVSGVGTVLVDSAGLTLYSVKTPSEANGNIKCTGTCTTFWIPVTASSVSQGSSGLPGKLGIVHRPDGKTQVTYNGMPLYTFKLDTAAGQAHGNNYTDSFDGTTFTWQALTSSGAPAGGNAPAPAPSASSSQPGGYGY